MNARVQAPNDSTYTRVIAASRKARWQIDRDVIQQRKLDQQHKYLPDGLSFAHTLDFLTTDEQRLVSQIQGRSYANIFGLVERFINAKVLELSSQYWMGDQTALEALVRFSDEELKHQELFRRVEQLAAEGMPAGYDFVPNPDEVARVVLTKSTWAVLALTCHIELFTLAHYRQSIEADATLSPLWKDVFRFHWMEESQHAVLDELEWRREDARLSAAARDRAVDDLIALVGAVDGILQAQAAADTRYFMSMMRRQLTASHSDVVGHLFLHAYRHQYIASGIKTTRFPEILFGMIDAAQRARIESALGPLL